MVAFAVYALYQYFGTSSMLAYVSANQDNPITQTVSQPVIPANIPVKKVATTASPHTTTTSQSQPKSVPAPTPAPVIKKNLYADGTYTGDVADAYYGNIQAQITIQNGKLTNVQFLQYPNDRSTSRYINGMAMPALKSEAISAQSSNVDIVSGATDSSQAFIQSLASALSQAKNS